MEARFRSWLKCVVAYVPWRQDCRHYWAVVAVLVTLLAVAGCGKESGDQRTVISLAAVGGEREEKMYDEMVSAFERVNPDLRVKRMDVPNRSFFTKLQVMVAGGMAPDLIPMMTMRLPMFVHRHAFRALDDLMAGDEQFAELKRDIYPKSMEGFALDGKTYGLAYSQNLYGLYYNKTIFDEFNRTCPPGERISYPSADWDLAKFVEVARKLTRDTDGDGRADQFGTATGPAVFYIIAPVLRRFGTNIFDDQKRVCVLDRPEAIAALDWYFGLGLRERVAPSPVGPDTRLTGGLIGGSEELFMSGRVAMWEGETEWRFEFKRRIAGFEWDVAEPPHGPAPGNVQTAGYECFGMCMSATSKHPKEAWRFLRFLISPEGQKILTRHQIGVPVLKSMCYSKEYFLNDADPPRNKEAFLRTMEYGQDLPSLRNYQEVWEAVVEELDWARIGARPTDEACRRATARANQLLKEDREQ